MKMEENEKVYSMMLIATDAAYFKKNLCYCRPFKFNKNRNEPIYFLNQNLIFEFVFGISNCKVIYNKHKNEVILAYKEEICPGIFVEQTKKLSKEESFDILTKNAIWITAHNNLKFKNEKLIPFVQKIVEDVNQIVNGIV